MQMGFQITVGVDDQLLERVEEYRRREPLIRSQPEALRILVEYALDQLGIPATQAFPKGLTEDLVMRGDREAARVEGKQGVRRGTPKPASLPSPLQGPTDAPMVRTGRKMKASGEGAPTKLKPRGSRR
jgi:hypothetical protein